MGERYPREIESGQKRLQSLQEVLHNGVNTPGDLQRLAEQERQLQGTIQGLMERKAAADKAKHTDKAFLQVA